MTKTLILIGLFTLTFIVPKNFNLTEFLMNTKQQGTTLYKVKPSDPTPDGYIELSSKKLRVSLYDVETETPELKTTLQNLVNISTSPIITTQDLLDVQLTIANDMEKTDKEKLNALIEIENIRQGKE